MHKPYLVFSGNKPGMASLLFKAAAAKNAEIMRKKTPKERRETQHALADVRPLPSGIEIQPETLAGVPCEWIFRPDSPLDKIVVYIHGGSWMMGDLKTARPVGVLLAEHTGCRVLVVEYRLAPEHPYPAALEDCEAVYLALRKNYAADCIALFGDSAGGNLSLCLCHRLRELGEAFPAVIGLASPVVEIGPGSALWLQKPDLLFCALPDESGESDIFSLYAPPEKWKHPLLSPINGELGDLPPILIHVGGDEPLSADGKTFAARVHQAGGCALTKIWREMFHDFSIVGVTLKESRQSLGEMCAFLTTHLHKADA